MNRIQVDRSQMVVINQAGKTWRTGWAMIYADGTSPGLTRARFRERRGLGRIDGLDGGVALVPVRTYTPAGGWPNWGIEFTGQPIVLADDESLAMSVARFCELTGWTAS